MRPIKYIRILTFSAMILIIFLQSLWILNAFKLMQKQLHAELNTTFETSIQKELFERLALIKSDNSITLKDTTIAEVDIDLDEGNITSVNLMFQEHLYQNQYTISIHKLDTIFYSEIAREKIYSNFIINRLNPETEEVLETTDTKGTGILKGALASEIIPIRMDGSEGVQVLLVSPYRAVFRQMLFTLILSLLLILFVGYALFFLLRSFTKERHWRQLQLIFRTLSRTIWPHHCKPSIR